ncbi:MAG: dye decolorizing peroxidase [Actinomycetota bacterium]|nr:dye decolorizing peroxidase [Actinomycetota bacterium]
MRRILLAATAALVWLGVAAGPASAHSVSGVSASNYHTHLTGVTPEVAGLEVKVVEAGSRLQVTNHTGQEVVVLGYKDEPYLRIGPDGVFQNKLSPATYINQTRKGNEPPPSATNAKVGDTDWEKVSSDPVARWHDHRIHWMSSANPGPVQASPGRRHVINPEWVVTLKQGAGTIAVKGDLVWEPGSSALPWYGLIVALVALVVVLGRRANWAPALAAVTAVLVAIDIFHAVGLGLANAGGLGERLAKSITQSPFSVLGWAAGVLAIVWLLRGRSDGLSAAALAGLLVALLGGVSDATALSRSEVPFGFGAGAARLAIAASIGLGFGLALAAALRLSGVVGPARARKETPELQTA